MFDETIPLNSELLKLAFKGMPKRYFEVPKSGFKKYDDFLQKIVGSNAERIGIFEFSLYAEHVRYVIEKNSLSCNRVLITDIYDEINWNINNADNLSNERTALICIGRSNPYFFNLID